MTVISLARAGACLAALSAALPPMAHAIEPVPIVVKAADAQAVATADQAAATIARTPGGVDLVPASDFQNSHAVDLHDMLAFSPGVFAQPRWGEEVRLSIRGSGIGRSFHLRGVTLLQDGVPINTADGSGDFQEIDPLMLSHLEVYRGANALRFGASSLGGAINAVTPSARALGTPFEASVEGGSFGTWRGHAAGGYAGDRADLLIAVTGSGTDGYRQQSEQFKIRINANYGYKLSDSAETRFYITLNHLDQQVPGTLTMANVQNNPRSAPAINRLNDFQRNIRSVRAQNRTTVDLGSNTALELGGFVNVKSLYHPIGQLIDFQSVDWGGYARMTGQNGPLSWTLGTQAQIGIVDARQYVNVGGHRGALRAKADLGANTLSAYGEARMKLAQGLTAIGGAQFTSGRRKADDLLNPARSDARTYQEWSPKLGLLYESGETLQFYANVSRAAEVPTFSELVQGTVQQFVPLDVQRSWTAEIGTRGRAGIVSWDVSAYRAWVKGELLGFTYPNIPASTFNADRTLHQGVEAALDIHMGQGLTFRQVYNFSDFRFRDDPQFGDNRLPVVPKHQYRAELQWKTGRFGLTPSVEWIPEGAWADYRNSVRVPAYAVANLGATAKVDDRVTLFIDARNLLDKRGVADISAAVAATGASAIYYPLDGRAVYGGLRFRLP